MQIDGVNLDVKANIYFDGKVVSYTFFIPDWSRRTVGIIFPGKYEFKTDHPENMFVTSGFLEVSIAGAPQFYCRANEAFDVPRNTKFQVICGLPVEYICTYRPNG